MARIMLSMKVFLLASLPVAALLAINAPSLLQRNTDALTKAESATVKFKMIAAGGATTEQSLTLSKPNMLKWDTPAQLVLCDGKSVTTYDKAKKTYTVVPITEGAPTSLMGSEAVWAWTAFFNPKIGEQILTEKKGKTLSQRGVSLTEAIIARKGGEITLLVDDASGLVKGGNYISKDGTSMIFQAEVTVSAKPAAPEKFAWVAPEGATEATIAAASGLHYADIKPILDSKCVNCHGGANGTKGRVNLSSYQSIMSSRVINKDTPENSRMIREMRRGSMPPGGGMPSDDIDKISQWIKDGANE